MNAKGRFYSMVNTNALLFIEDGGCLGRIASRYALGGSQWGVINEIESWPGQPWLCFYTLSYQIRPWSTVGTDIVVIATVVPIFLVLVLLPFIPGFRSLPRALGLYRIVWRSYLPEVRPPSPGRGVIPP